MFDFENKDVDLRGWYYEFLKIFEECGLVPTMIEMMKDTPEIEGTRILVKNATKRLEESNFKGYRGFLIYATPSSDLRNPFKWLMQLSIDLASNREVFSLDFDSELMPFNEATMGGDI